MPQYDRSLIEETLKYLSLAVEVKEARTDQEILDAVKQWRADNPDAEPDGCAFSLMAQMIGPALDN